MPSTTKYSANLSASTKTANVLAGDTLEFVPYPATIRIYAVSSAIGVNITLLADSDMLIEDKEIPFIGTSLVKKDQLLDEFMVQAGTRLSLFLRETAAAATTDVYTCVEVEPL